MRRFKLPVSSYSFTVFYVSDFAITFLHARDRSKATVKHTSFDTSVIEVQQNELTSFLEALTEG